MKTLKEIDADILKHQKEIEALRKDNKSESRVSNSISMLRKARIYIESRPSVEFVQRQKGELLNRLHILDDRYRMWLSQGERQKLYDPKKVYYKEMNIDMAEVNKWKSELKFINYILS